MKRILVCLVLFGLVYPGAYSLTEPVVVVANSIDKELNIDFIDFLSQEREVILVQPAEFELHKTSKYIVVLGGCNALETGEIVSGILTDNEAVTLSTKSMMVTTLNVWQDNQVVVVLAGPDREQTEMACKENREAVTALFKGVETVLEMVNQEIVFLWPHPVTVSDEVAPYAPTPLRPQVTELPHLVPYTLKGKSWFFWIDDVPYAKYAHSTRFIFFRIEAKTYSIHQEQWWPVLNGTSLWVESNEYWNSRYWVYNPGFSKPNFFGLPRSSVGLKGSERPEVEEPVSIDRALIINGWSTGQPLKEDMTHDERGMQEALTAAGMRVENVTTTTKIQEILQKWATTMDSGNLVIYITAHGNRGYFFVGGTVFTVHDLLTLLNNYRGVHIHVVVDACYAGSLIDPVKYVAETIITATNGETVAYGDVDSEEDPNPDDAGSEFTGGLVEGIKELLKDAKIKEWKPLSPRESWYSYLFTEAFKIARDKDVCARKRWTLPRIWVGTTDVEALDKPEGQEEGGCPCGK